MITMNGHIWVIGGQTPYGAKSLYTMEYIDFENPQQWKKEEIPFGAFGHCVSELPNNQLLVTGGRQQLINADGVADCGHTAHLVRL